MIILETTVVQKNPSKKSVCFSKRVESYSEVAMQLILQAQSLSSALEFN